MRFSRDIRVEGEQVTNGVADDATGVVEPTGWIEVARPSPACRPTRSADLLPVVAPTKLDRVGTAWPSRHGSFRIDTARD